MHWTLRSQGDSKHGHSEHRARASENEEIRQSDSSNRTACDDTLSSYVVEGNNLCGFKTSADLRTFHCVLVAGGIRRALRRGMSCQQATLAYILHDVIGLRGGIDRYSIINAEDLVPSNRTSIDLSMVPRFYASYDSC